MSLINYFLAEPSTVIALDDRDPRVSWQHHLDRTRRDPGGPRGGIDIVAPIGTPVYARTDGTMRHKPKNGSAGNSCEFEHTANPGWRDVFSHLSAYVGKSGRKFAAGEIVGYTGNTGGVAPHLHWHLLDPKGVRRNPWDYFSPASNMYEGEEMPIAVTLASGAHKGSYTISLGRLRRWNNSSYLSTSRKVEFEFVAKQFNPDRKVLKVSQAQFWALLDAYDIPRTVTPMDLETEWRRK
ncbi:M23 family metallopeptidase [Homoserinibacter sp. YIM 151385]|uniref:M23 family metallopeptidase n=1 Tax=Homoserinibacter sp. YIM 151385 TaxID=2985506 RepID=UPI0022EFF5C4|nr:M23 family metallopeptidase [Homoserinibacter sp. YIM 151385]WBU37619.1 M23 family metallopeptidase [Homoserinibacter sp. YIM 151385]